MERPDSELYRGGRLTAAQQWRDAVNPALTAVEREFLDASAANETAGLAAAQRQLRRRSWVSAGAAALAIVAVMASLWGFQANLAGERATVAEARRVAGLALDEPDFDRALLLAVEAIHSGTIPRHVSTSYASSRAPRLTSIIRIPEDGVAAEHGALAERDPSIGHRQRPRRAPVRSGQQSQLGEYSPFGRMIIVTSAIDPVSGRRRVQRDIGPANLAATRRRNALSENGSRSGVTPTRSWIGRSQTSSSRPTDPYSQRLRRHRSGVVALGGAPRRT